MAWYWAFETSTHFSSLVAGAGFTGGVGDGGADGADLLVVRAGVAGAADFHVDEDLVPRLVELRG